MSCKRSSVISTLTMVYFRDLHNCVNGTTIINFPNLGSTYNGGWCLATRKMKLLSKGLLAELAWSKGKPRCLHYCILS